MYGDEIRKCVIAPKGRKLVGIDMKSAQLAIASYYAKNSEYYDAVASGQEEVDDDSFESGKRYVGMSAHCHSARNFGMVSIEEFERAVKYQEPELLHSIALRRKNSKGASFGVIFGCAGSLLAKMLGIPEQEGNEKKDNFLRQMGLDGVANWLEGCQTKYKAGRGWYIPLPFGYWVHCKSPHKSINYLIQATEAVAQKLAVNRFEKLLAESSLDAFKVLDYHDEILLEASDEDANAAGELACQCYEWASNQIFKWHKENPELFANEGSPIFAFNLNGGYKVGDNYLDVH